MASGICTSKKKKGEILIYLFVDNLIGDTGHDGTRIQSNLTSMNFNNSIFLFILFFLLLLLLINGPFQSPLNDNNHDKYIALNFHKHNKIDSAILRFWIMLSTSKTIKKQTF